jgi:tetratricopeptide (TPR) repeat protein
MTAQVFVSYSHANAEAATRFLQHLHAFKDIRIWADPDLLPGNRWRDEIERSVAGSSVAVLLVSVEFLDSSFIRETELQWLFDRQRDGKIRLYPIILHPSPWRQLLGHIQARVMTAHDGPQRDQEFATIAEEIHGMLAGAVPGEDGQTYYTRPARIAMSDLPVTPFSLFGRDSELSELDRAWGDRRTAIVTLIAPGGLGKTALLNHWLAKMNRTGYAGADAVLAWSFYLQGTRGEPVGSAGPFIQFALRWFGDANPEQGSPVDKAHRLVALIRAQRTLLVLDGLEPLQRDIDPTNMASIADEALRTLVTEVASNPGLTIITTRSGIKELQRFEDGVTVRRIHLRPLAAAAGAQILAEADVHGAPSELEAAAKELGGHSLALTLLANYLVEHCDGDVTRRHSIEGLLQASGGDHAQRMLRSYDRILTPRERAVMQIVSLFDRPAETAAMAMVASEPVIRGFTEPLFDASGSWFWKRRIPMPEIAWHGALRRLRNAGLLSPSRDRIDTHPLIREYFAETLEHSNAWLDAHERLFIHFSGRGRLTPYSEQGMQNFYVAMLHGCLAGLYKQALWDVYVKKIAHGDEFYSTRKLGMVSDDLAALARFFERPWDRPRAALTRDSRAFVLQQAGVMLMTTGRIGEARTALLAALNDYREWDHGYAAVAASNLSQLHTAIGEFDAARSFAEDAIRLAEEGNTLRWKIGARTDLGDVLRQTGHPDQALPWFEAAEVLELQFTGLRLYSFPGFRYCELLMDLGRLDDAEDRARDALALTDVRSGLGLLHVGLSRLNLGRIALIRARESPVTLTHALAEMEAALDAIRRSGHRDHLPRALCGIGEVLTQLDRFDRASQTLDESLAITREGGMKVAEVDTLLSRARLRRARGETDVAAEDIAAAASIIHSTGYRRRERDLALFADS